MSRKTFHESRVSALERLELHKRFDNFDTQVSKIKDSTLITECEKPFAEGAEGMARFYKSQLQFESKLLQHSVFLAAFWGLLHKLIFKFKNYSFMNQEAPFKKLFIRSTYASDINKVDAILKDMVRGTIEIADKLKAAATQDDNANFKLIQTISSKELEVILVR